MQREELAEFVLLEEEEWINRQITITRVSNGYAIDGPDKSYVVAITDTPATGLAAALEFAAPQLLTEGEGEIYVFSSEDFNAQ